MSDQTPKSPPHANPLMVQQGQFFSSLPVSLQQEMATHFRLEERSKSEEFHPDQLLTRFYTLIDGQIEVIRESIDDGREITVDVLYPGDSFDVITLLDHRPHRATFSPLSALKLMYVPMQVMRQWLWTYPEVNQQFLPYLANKMREQEELAANLVQLDVSTRLSRLILKHINRSRSYQGNRAKEHQDHLITGLSDEALARMVGSVRQVINKQLQYWKSKGILSKKRNEIVIKDLDALYEEAKYTETHLQHHLKTDPSRNG